jgi:peptide/nickel transport system substrate-binding protein
MEAKMKKYLGVFTVLALFTILFLLFSGCGQQPASSVAPSAKPPTTTGPKYGGILKLSANTDAVVLGWPPRFVSYVDTGNVKPAVESLMRYNSKVQPQPWLAESWTTDAAAKTITFKLRKGVKFHDGTDFNAAAVKWNLEKYVESGIGMQLPKAMKIDVVDDFTAKVTLPSWDSTILGIIADAGLAGKIISPTAWQNAPGAKTDKERDDWCANNPVGTGPFKFVSWQKTVKQVYTKFDGYWQKGKPYLDGMEWTVIADPSTASAAFKAKEVDGLIWIATNTARDLKAAGYSILSLESGTQIKTVSANSINPTSPFSNVKLRQAISYAIDRKAIADGVFFGYAAPIQQCGLLGSDYINPDWKGFPYDPEKAKQLVAEAGYPNGVNATIATQSFPDDIAICTAVQAMLAKANINMKIETMEPARHIQLLAQGPYDSMALIYLRANLDQPLPISRSVGASSAQNKKSVMQPEEVDKLIQQAQQAPDLASKQKLVWQLQDVVFNKYCIFNPVVITFPIAAVQNYVKGDGIMKTYVNEWTPEDTWLDK